ncbi:LOW QUALITY PROTEIN: NYN domain-containing protein/OST-HTH domain-containing protein/OHA domain-containing protein [Cephalotus follicularis]|uniref:NYN domain-containing protein/OST-HTH domain-containing protein/OHA domain-containing protein n=1 Tax=Cephalotus follicularis TaxID=3775 RepID=A0A1Q3C6Y8_CEPFO|nr:LOW QUALITY PROTEIN: NYN domain-containing protein/OST-HTH domain-containing protein/OHA domain-containing protein [Cephalotus follicularis]
MMNLKPFSPKTLARSLFLSSPYTLLISHFSTSPNYPAHPHSSARRYEEESKNVRVSVWWDFENCNVPAGVNVFKVANTITAAIRSCGIKGSIQITAFGDVLQLSRANQEALSSTGISLSHVPNGRKNSADRSLLMDLMYWVSQNPPPAHLFLISSDRDFASILHRLRMSNYNILLASTENAPSVLCSAASIMWQWNTLLKGENLTVRHFNQPPDGPFGSWYGHYKVPLQDPFSVVQESACSWIDEFPDASSSKIRPVPKAVTKQVRHILNLYPKGLSITDLRTELSKSNVSVDKDLFGYKKFSRFLLSMPHILKLQSRDDGQFLVRGIPPKSPEPYEFSSGTSSGPANKNGEQYLTSSKSTDEGRSVIAAVDEKSKLPPSPEVNGEASRKLQQLPPIYKKVVKMDVEEPSEKVQRPPQVGTKIVEVVNTQATEGHMPTVVKQDTASEVGFLRKMWHRWFGSYHSGSQVSCYDVPEVVSNSGIISEKKSGNTLEKCCTSGEISEKAEIMEKLKESQSQDADTVQPVSFSSSGDDSALDNKTATSAEKFSDKAATSPGFFIRIVNWCTFWRSSPNSDKLGDQSSDRLKQIKNHSGKHEVFTKDFFWNDIESFLHMPRGSFVVSESRTREHMAQNLQKEGPLVLRSLGDSDLLHLVDLLISEKKWVEECPSLMSPFKLTQPEGLKSSSGPHAAKGLRSIFLGTASPEQVEKKFENISHTGVSSPITNRKPSDKSRSEILVDCQKLVEEVLKEHPEGYNMGTFRKLFFERYGYILDTQKLGYRKLASLLQVMPGLKIESCYIVPSGKRPKMSGMEAAVPTIYEDNACLSLAISDDESSEASKKYDDFDSQWEELGPVAKPSSDRTELQSVVSRTTEETSRLLHPYYEPSLSDDEFSDSEGETSYPTQPEGRGKPGVHDEDSSLLQILDSCYSRKERSNRNEEPANADDSFECSTNSLMQLGMSGGGSKSRTSSGNDRRKQRFQKSYTFVSEPLENNKDTLIDGILGSLKKGESRNAELKGFKE